MRSTTCRRGVLDRFPDGVWLVELAPLADPQLVVPALATTLTAPVVSGGLGIGYQLGAVTSQLHGDLDQAQSYAEASLAAFESSTVADSRFALIPRSILAELAWRRCNLDHAEREFKDMLPFWLDSGNRGAVARLLELLAFISRARAEESASAPAPVHLTRAATLLGAAEAIRSTYEADMVPYERDPYEAEVAALRQQMNPQTLVAAWAAGEKMGLEEAVEWAQA